MSSKRRVYPGQSPQQQPQQQQPGYSPTPANSQASMGQLTSDMHQMNLSPSPYPQQQQQQLPQQPQQLGLVSPQPVPQVLPPTQQPQYYPPTSNSAAPQYAQPYQQPVQQQPYQQQQPGQPVQYPGTGGPATYPAQQQQTQQYNTPKNVQLIGMQPQIGEITEKKADAGKLKIQMQNPNHTPVACPYEMKCCTLTNIPKDFTLLQKSKIPLGIQFP